MEEKGLEFRFPDSQPEYFSHTHFPVTASSHQMSLLLPIYFLLFPFKFIPRRIYDASYFHFLTSLSLLDQCQLYFLTKTTLIKATCNFYVAGLINEVYCVLTNGLHSLPYYWTAQLASTHLVTPIVLATLSTPFVYITTPSQIFFYLIDCSFSIPLSWIHPPLPPHEVLECPTFAPWPVFLDPPSLSDYTSLMSLNTTYVMFPKLEVPTLTSEF